MLGFITLGDNVVQWAVHQAVKEELCTVLRNPNIWLKQLASEVACGTPPGDTHTCRVSSGNFILEGKLTDHVAYSHGEGRVDSIIIIIGNILGGGNSGSWVSLGGS